MKGGVSGVVCVCVCVYMCVLALCVCVQVCVLITKYVRVCWPFADKTLKLDKSPSFYTLGNGKIDVGIPDCEQICEL